MAAIAAEFERVSKFYPAGFLGRSSLQALDDVSFQINEGEVLGLLGPNRAGKTTLVKILLNICSASDGRAQRLGRPVSDRATLARVGYVHENQAFPRYWDAAGLLEFYGALTRLPQTAVRAAIPRLLETVGLADRASEPISRFSKGMLQRLGIAQALINDPDLLVLDEPTEGLDLDGLQVVREIIAQRRRAGRTVVLVSHSLAEVERLCDRVAVLVGGRLAYTGTIADLGRAKGGSANQPLVDALQALYKGFKG